MYSKNDYRYYREDRLIHSDDFLAHYGVKGMKWKHRKNITMDQDRGMNRTRQFTQFTSNAYDPSAGGNRSRHDVYYRSGKSSLKGMDNYKKNGNRVGTNTNSAKTRMKDKLRRVRAKHNAKNSIFNKNMWKRDKIKGKKLSKKSNISVSHNTTIK